MRQSGKAHLNGHPQSNGHARANGAAVPKKAGRSNGRAAINGHANLDGNASNGVASALDFEIEAPASDSGGLTVNRASIARDKSGALRYFRHGSVVTGWEITHERPGRLRLKNQVLYRKSGTVPGDRAGVGGHHTGSIATRRAR